MWKNADIDSEPPWTVSATHTTMHSGDNKLKIEVRVSPRHLTGLSTAMLIIQLFIQYDFKHAGAQRILEKENRNLIVKRNAIHVSLMCRIDDQRILQTSQAKKLKQKCALKKLGSSSPSVSYRVRIDARRILETCQTERHPCLTDTDAHSRSKNTPNLPSYNKSVLWRSLANRNTIRVSACGHGCSKKFRNLTNITPSVSHPMRISWCSKNSRNLTNVTPSVSHPMRIDARRILETWQT